MKLRVLDEADADAIEAANWYEERSPGLGYDFHAEVQIFENEILVLAVSHGSRDQDYWKGRVQ